MNKSDWEEESNLCWAAGASNIIAWWQAKASLGLIPEKAPCGVDNIFADFKRTFKNVGISSTDGFAWYFGGSPLADNTYEISFQNKETARITGKYWENFVKEKGPDRSDYGVPKYVEPHGMQETYETQGCAASFVEDVRKAFSAHCGVTLSFNTGSNGHLITLWGIEVGEDDSVKLWLTDSDDNSGLFSCGFDLLTNTESYGDGKDGDPILQWTKTTAYLTDYRQEGDKYEITRWEALKLPYAVIPEPSSFGPLAGTLVLAFAASRRRRRRE